MKDEEKLKSFLTEIIKQEQKEPRTAYRVDVRSFYFSQAEARLARTVLNIIEHGFNTVDYKVHCGDKVFNPETKIFEKEK